jgi:hypothetical protein
VNEGELDQLRTMRHVPSLNSQNWYSRAGLPDAATAVHVTGWPTGRFPVLDADRPDNAVVNAPIDAAVPTSWAALYAATEKSYQTPAVKPCTDSRTWSVCDDVSCGVPLRVRILRQGVPRETQSALSRTARRQQREQAEYHSDGLAHMLEVEQRTCPVMQTQSGFVTW